MRNFLLIMALFMLAACTNTNHDSSTAQADNDPFTLIVKRGYKLGDEVDKFTNHKLGGWQYVSNDAVIIPGRKRDYLVTLRTQCQQLRWTNTIGLTGTGSTTLSRFDAIVVVDKPKTLEQKCYIDKIFELEEPAPKDSE